MPYITASNAKRVVKHSDGAKIDFGLPIYFRPIYVFSKPESNILAGVRCLFEDSEKFIRLCPYKKIETEDTFSYVEPEKQPSYHVSASCERLNSDFETFKIPKEIREQGKEKVYEFRKWAKANMHLMREPDLFKTHLIARWGGAIDFSLVKVSNAGVAKHENLSLPELEARAESLLNKPLDLQGSSTAHHLILDRFAKSTALAYFTFPLNGLPSGVSETETRFIMKEFHEEVKIPLRDTLIEWYRVATNADTRFSENVLESLGFRKCAACYGALLLKDVPLIEL